MESQTSKRYFFKIAYNGTNYSGWQRQPNATTVQQTIEEELTKVCRQKISIMGCGRTDAGVHASSYFFHTDLPANIDINELLFKLNQMVPKDIVFYDGYQVPQNAHTRFDAVSRDYIYHISHYKEVFGESFHYYASDKFDLSKLNAAAKLLLDYKEFYPFCKSNSDVNNYFCTLTKSEWIQTSNSKFEYHISANRFLRGMVRLVVGMCLNHMEGKISLKEVTTALQTQTRLPRDLSMAAKGLFLHEIHYPIK